MNQVFTQPVGWHAHVSFHASARRAPLGPALSYAVAALVASSMVGALIASLGAALRDGPPPVVGWTLVAGAAMLTVLAVGLEREGLLGPLPQRRAQVPRSWTHWPSHRVAVGFGLMLGAGVLTFLHHATAYVVGVTILLAPSPLIGAIIGGVYGLGRGAVLFDSWLRPHDDRWPEGRPALTARAASALPAVALASGFAAIALAAINL